MILSMVTTPAMPYPPPHRELFDPAEELVPHTGEPHVVRYVSPDGTDGWLVRSYALARQVLADQNFARDESLIGELRAAQGGAPSGPRSDWELQLAELLGPSSAGGFLNMDGERHARFRRLLGGRFSPKYVSTLAERVTASVERALEVMENADQPFDFVSGFAVPVALEIICDVLGIRVRPEWHLIVGVMERQWNGQDVDPSVLAHYRDFAAAMEHEVDHVLQHPNSGIISFLLEEGSLSRAEIIGVGHLLVVAGHHTTSNMMSLGILLLQRDPCNWDDLVSGAVELGPVVEELLRHITVLQRAPFARVAMEDTELGGARIRAGDFVQVSAVGANRDPAFLSDPMEFDPARDSSGHLSFGYGIHQCLGQHLARLELRIVFRAVGARFPSLRPAVSPESLPLHPTTFPGHGVEVLPVVWSTPEVS